MFDESRYVGTYFSFHVLPVIDCDMLLATFAKLTPLLHSTLMQVIAAVPQHGAGIPQRFSLLTVREREIADYISKGKSNSEIAKLLSVSDNTIRNHVSRILDKTGCGNRAGLAHLVAQQESMLYGMGTKVL
jgi:DNA-binding NarL/FixJ family response regulator